MNTPIASIEVEELAEGICGLKLFSLNLDFLKCAKYALETVNIFNRIERYVPEGDLQKSFGELRKNQEEVVFETLKRDFPEFRTVLARLEAVTLFHPDDQSLRSVDGVCTLGDRHYLAITYALTGRAMNFSSFS